MSTASEMTRNGITLPMDHIGEFCRRWKIRELAVFGSFLRDDFRDDSDIDFLYRFHEGARWDFGDYLRMKDDLAGIVGRPVDLVARREIERSDNWVRRGEILDRSEVIHVS